MIATSETQNLWIGRFAWTFGILVVGAGLWFLVARVRGGHLPVLGATSGAVIGAVVVIIVSGGGAVIEGVALGLLAGLSVGRVTTLIQRKRSKPPQLEPGK